VLANSAQSGAGKVLRRICLIVLISVCHALLIELVMRLAVMPTPEAPSEAITYLSMLPLPPTPVARPALQGAQTAPLEARPSLMPPIPTQRRSKQRPRATLAALTAPRDPCALVFTQGQKHPRDPACDPHVQANPSLQLNLPGGFHQDDNGAIVQNQASLFSQLPPESPEQIQEEAGRHQITLVNAFGPPYPTPKMPEADPVLSPYGPTEKGPVIQLLEDRLRNSPLTPQTTLRWHDANGDSTLSSSGYTGE
jgi:hypothetical protein